MQYPLANAFLTIFWFFIWILWIFLVIRILFDVFASRDLSGGVKALWVILIILVPFLGVLIYLIARGGKMHERQVREEQAQEREFRAYVRDAAGSGPSDELSKLADLRDRGIISDEEFQQGKAKILGAPAGTGTGTPAGTGTS